MAVPSASLDVRSGGLAPGDGPVLVVHGGAWNIPDDALADHRDGLRAALERGRSALEAGDDALTVVTEAVAVLEAHGAFDAGVGSVLNLDGDAELDAGVMRGVDEAVGSVLGVRQYAAPVRIAERLLHVGRGEVRMLAGVGAETFAHAQGFAAVTAERLRHPREVERHARLRAEQGFLPSFSFGMPRGTVGAVARDRRGHLAAATSTGGTPLKPPGRVGDSPLPGAGFYASTHGAASSTGWGEAILSALLAVRAVDRLADGRTPEASARQGLERLGATFHNVRGEAATAGLILLGADGAAAWAYTTPRMARGLWRADAGLSLDV